MDKRTNADRVMEVIERDGFITNFYAMNEMYILRLAAVIHQLQKEGRIVIDKANSGYIGKSKNYKYIALPSHMMRDNNQVPDVQKKEPIKKAETKTQTYNPDCDCKFCHPNIDAFRMATKSYTKGCMVCGCTLHILSKKAKRAQDKM